MAAFCSSRSSSIHSCAHCFVLPLLMPDRRRRLARACVTCIRVCAVFKYCFFFLLSWPPRKLLHHAACSVPLCVACMCVSPLHQMPTSWCYCSVQGFQCSLPIALLYVCSKYGVCGSVLVKRHSFWVATCCRCLSKISGWLPVGWQLQLLVVLVAAFSLSPVHMASAQRALASVIGRQSG